MNHLVFANDGVVNEDTPLGRLKLLDRLIDGPNVFQICPSVDFDTPQCLAIFALDQCVAFASVNSSASLASSNTGRQEPGHDITQHARTYNERGTTRESAMWTCDV